MDLSWCYHGAIMYIYAVMIIPWRCPEYAMEWSLSYHITVITLSCSCREVVMGQSWICHMTIIIYMTTTYPRNDSVMTAP